MINLHELLEQLMMVKSITPRDHGCQNTLIHALETLGFTCQRFDNPPVSNFFARLGREAPLLVFAGHTDVVPAGDESLWHSEPFSLHQDQGYYYGRGIADMKGALACMVIAVQQFLTTTPAFHGSIGFLITSGEEGDDFHLGTPWILEQLVQQNIRADYCIVGEPSSQKQIGDMIKIGRRGSLSAKLTVHGLQGHVAYPHLANNPIHAFAGALKELTSITWDNGNDYFAPTSLQITAIQSGGSTGNVIPGTLTCAFNLRYSTENTATALQEQIESLFKLHQLQFDVEWRQNGAPFLTPQGKLVSTCIDVSQDITGITPELSTSGGTSDARFIAPLGIDVIELGLLNASIHQINECSKITDLTMLTTLYHQLCLRLLLNV